MRCVPAHYFTVAKALAWRSAIDDDPAYQRESAVWSLDQQQLFIDSLINGYDVPKIYLHDLRGRHPTKVYAVVDGKQRLTTIWAYLQDGFPLAPTFQIEPGNMPDVLADAVAPAGALRFSQLDPRWRAVLMQTFLSVVLIHDATEEDIEELFSRLNNGVPLGPAERRNALGGEMATLIREIAGRAAFAMSLGFSNGRRLHFDLAARVLALEDARLRGAEAELDLSPVGLDAFVRQRRRLATVDRLELVSAIDRRLAASATVFSTADPLLASPAAAFAYLRFAWEALGEDPTAATTERVRSFLDGLRRTRRRDGSSDADTAGPRLVDLGAAYERQAASGAASTDAVHRDWPMEARGDGDRPGGHVPDRAVRVPGHATSLTDPTIAEET